VASIWRIDLLSRQQPVLRTWSSKPTDNFIVIERAMHVRSPAHAADTLHRIDHDARWLGDPSKFQPVIPFGVGFGLRLLLVRAGSDYSHIGGDNGTTHANIGQRSARLVCHATVDNRASGRGRSAGSRAQPCSSVLDRRRRRRLTEDGDRMPVRRENGGPGPCSRQRPNIGWREAVDQ
jgi:hypothetical protein